jgi:putative membrane protein
MTASPAIVVAQMWDGNDHMDGGWWWVMGIGWLIFLAVVVVLAVLLLRHVTTGPARSSSAGDILAERFARGEIDEDEYRRRRSALRGTP